MPKKNIALLKRLRTRFLRMRHLEHFNIQEVAIKTDCGTAMCIAGHTLNLLGYKVRFDNDGDAVWFTPNGHRIHADPLCIAQQALGLDREVALNYNKGLFYDFSTRTPKQAAKRIEQLITEG